MTLFDSHSAQAEQATLLLKALAHPDRLVVVCQLLDGEKRVAELLAHSQLSQSAFSQQLSVLRHHGLIVARKEAQQIFYSLADANLAALLMVLRGYLDRPWTLQPESPSSIPSTYLVDDESVGSY